VEDEVDVGDDDDNGMMMRIRPLIRLFLDRQKPFKKTKVF